MKDTSNVHLNAVFLSMRAYKNLTITRRRKLFDRTSICSSGDTLSPLLKMSNIDSIRKDVCVASVVKRKIIIDSRERICGTIPASVDVLDSHRLGKENKKSDISMSSRSPRVISPRRVIRADARKLRRVA